MDGYDCTVNDIVVLAGCCANMFSLHIALKTVYADPSVLSQPLFAFEVARNFAIENVKQLLSRVEQWKLAEGYFRIWASMVKKMASPRRVGFQDGEIYQNAFSFSRFNDTLFDKAICRVNYLL